MNQNLIIGIAASILTAISLMPQLIKIWKEKKAEDVSLLMLGVLLAGLCLWVWYGIKIKDFIIIIANGFSILINISVIILTLLYKKNTSPSL